MANQFTMDRYYRDDHFAHPCIKIDRWITDNQSDNYRWDIRKHKSPLLPFNKILCTESLKK